MRANGTLALGALVALTGLSSGCSSVREDFRPVPSDAPFVYDIGELRVIDADELGAADLDHAAIEDALHYGQLGVGESAGVFGGATFQFRGTGRDVCIVVDPESVFWNREISAQATNTYDYEDLFEDDGDIDLSVGLTAYYTGSPGSEIGDFNAVYDDPSGVEHELAFNECVQIGLFGDPAHAGRGTVEYCSIDTSLREGVMYTALLETFALPIDDSILNFGTLAFDGSCGDLPWIDANGASQTGASECVIPNEVGNADPNGLPEEKAWFPDLEKALCTGKGKVNTFCDEGLGGCASVD